MLLATAILLLHPQLAVTSSTVRKPAADSDSAISASVSPLDSDLPLPMTTASSDALEPAGESTPTKNADVESRNGNSASAGIMDMDLPLPMSVSSDPALAPAGESTANSDADNAISAGMMDMDLPLPMSASSDPALSSATAADPEASVSASALDPDMPLPLTPSSEAAPEPAAEPTEALPDAPLPLPAVVKPTAPLAFIRPAKPMTVSVDELRAENRRRQMMWTGLAIASSGAATFDAWSTRHTITQDGAQEMNPLLKPFAGNGSLYVAIQVAPALLDYAGHKMMYSRHSWLRRTWWVPQSASFVTSMFCGAHNLAYH